MRVPLFLMALALAGPATAGTSWQDISAELFGDRLLTPGSGLIAIDSPYRTQNDARTTIAVQIAAPPGALVDRAWLVLDENPMPVSAVFDLAQPQPRFRFDVTMRINGPTPLHVVAETEAGQLFVAEGFVKTSGLGACSAPPGTDPDAALATLGEISIDVQQAGGGIAQRLAGLAGAEAQLDIDILHPSHSGMQMDQISLLFIPMRYVSDVAVDLDGGSFVEITGSISLSENPRIGMGVPSGTRQVGVTMTDTDGTVTHAEKVLPGF